MNKQISIIIFLLVFLSFSQAELNHEFSFELIPKHTQCFGEFFAKGTNVSVNVRINQETYEFFFGVYKFDQMSPNFSQIIKGKFPIALKETQVYYNSKKHEKDQFKEVFSQEISESSDYLICIRNVLPNQVKYYFEVIRTIPISKNLQNSQYPRSKKYKNEENQIDQVLNLEQNLIFDLDEIEKIQLQQTEESVQNIDFLVISLGIATIVGYSFISWLEMVIFKTILRKKKLI